MKNSYALEIFNDDDLMIMMGAVLERIAQLTRWMADHEECVGVPDWRSLEEYIDLSDKLRKILLERGIRYDFFGRR